MPVTNPPRNYLQAGGPPVIATQWLFDPTGVTDNGGGQGVTGYWRPVSSQDYGIDSINISGVNVNLGDLELAIGSGNAALFYLTGTLGVAFPTGYSAQTGQKLVGPAVVTSGYAPQYASGANGAFAFDTQNGGGLVQNTDLDKTVDSVSAFQPTFTSTSNYTFSGNASTYAMLTGQALAANPNRLQLFCQNLGSGLLFLKLGAGTCGTGSFSMILKAASATLAADGGIFTDNGAYQGAVTISGQTIAQIWEA